MLKMWKRKNSFSLNCSWHFGKNDGTQDKPPINEYDPIDERRGFLRIMSGFAECARCNFGVTDGVDNDRNARKRTRRRI